MSAFAVLMFLSAAQIAAALRCYCSDCSIGSECTGDLCYAQVVNGQHRWRCYSRAFSYLCNTSSVFHTTLCCDSADFCNANLTLSQPTPATTASSSTSSHSPTESTLAPMINPLTGSEPSNSEPTSSLLNTSTSQEGSHLLAHSCYESDSESENEDLVRLCELHSDNWCFSTWRRRSNGAVHFRRGCANSCEPVNRNRKVKLCCRTSLCNVEDILQNISNNSSRSGELLTTLSPSTPTTLPPSSPPSSPPISLRPIIEPETNSPAVTQTQATTITAFYCHCSDCGGGFCLTVTGCALQRVINRGRTVTTQFCLSEGNQDICRLNSTATTTECCTSGLCNRNLESTVLSPTTSPQSTTDQSEPSIRLPSLVPETTRQATTASTAPPLTGDPVERTSRVTTRLTVEPTTRSLPDTPSPNPHLNTSSKPSIEPQSQSLSIYYILIIVLSGLTCLIIACIVGVCIYLCVDYKRKQQGSVDICDQNKETDSSSSTPV